MGVVWRLSAAWERPLEQLLGSSIHENRGAMPMSVNTKAIVAQVNAAFAAGSTEGFLACCADDVAWTMVRDTTVHGKDAVRQWMASLGPREASQFTVHNVIAEGDFVTAYGDMTMKDK